MIDIAIIGAGIGGLAAALACSKAGFDVHVYEQAPQLGEVGAGLQIGPNALKVLNAMGIDLAAAPYVTQPDAIAIRAGDDGAVLSKVTLGEIARKRYGAPYLHIHRADLLAALHQALEAQAPGCITLGKQLMQLAQSQDSVALHFSDGSQVMHDVVIGADGIGSAVQAALFGDSPARFTGAQAWRAMIPASDGLAAAVRTPAVWIGKGQHAVTYPLRADAAINVVGVVPAGTPGPHSWKQSGDPAEMQAAFADWAPDLVALLANAQACFAWPLYDRPPLPRWTQDKVALLGDAAHPMLPYLAQGASMAIEDAYVLASTLAQRPSAQAAPQALKLYERRRKARTSRVQAAARVNGLFYHAGAAARPGAQLARRLGLSPGRTLDWLYSYDVPAMAGRKLDAAAL